MKMADEKFCVRWTDFESNISVAFKELREEKDFFDVTLVCNEGQIQAHKVILSACSSFFRSILKRNPHSHPLIFLKGVELGNLQFILDFMYNGEANVAQEELNSFLAVAEELKVKGLTQNQSKGKQESSSTAPLPKPAAPSCLPDEQPSTRRPPPTSVLQPKRHSVPLADYEPAQEFVSVKSEPCETSSIHQHQIDSTTTMQSIEGDYVAVEDYQDDDQYEGEGYNALQSGEVNGGFDPSQVACFEDLLQYVVRTERGYECPCGGFSHKSKSTVQYHVESKHFPNHFVWNCNICGKQAKTKTALLSHKYQFHTKQS